MKKKLKAFSLVEMLITLVIFSIVILLATQSLNTLIRVSTISNYKSVTRNEIDFASELLDRLLTNSNVSDVYLYNTRGVRYFIPSPTLDGNDLMGPQDGYENEEVMRSVYANGVQEGVNTGSEIHIRPYGNSLWICIGFFNDVDGNGYLLKRSVNTLTEHSECFNTDLISPSSSPIFVLNSGEVKVNNFEVSFVRSVSGNNIFYGNLEMEPVYWVSGNSEIERSVFRQVIVSTQGLTWY